MQLINLLKQFLKSIVIARKKIKKCFNKSLIVSAEDEERFQSSNKLWIGNILFDVGDNKVKDHDHITWKYRRSAQWSCKTNLKLILKVSIGFHNLKSYGSHLIMQGIGKSDLKISVLPNGLEKYMPFTINESLFFNGSMQFTNSKLDALVKNSSDNDFKCLSQRFSGEWLELVKQKKSI